MKLSARALWFALVASSLATAPAYAQRRARPAPAVVAPSLLGEWRYESIGATRGDFTFTATPEGAGSHFESTLRNTNCPACEGCECNTPIVRESGWYTVTGDRLVLHITERVTSIAFAHQTAAANPPRPRRSVVSETRTYRFSRVAHPERAFDPRAIPQATLIRGRDMLQLFVVTS